MRHTGLADQRTPALEVVLAFLAGAGTFASVAVVVVVVEADLLVLALALPLAAGVIAVAQRRGAAYAVPVAMAGVLAYDWYYIPPTHGHELPDSENVAQLAVYLTLGVLIGQVASRAGRRAAVSGAARDSLATEQAALRRVAALVARGVAPLELFAAVAREMGQVLGVDVTHIGRYEQDATVTGVASWSAGADELPVGTRASLEGESVSARVARTGRPARIDRYDGGSGSIAGTMRGLGVRSSVGAPIVADGRLWGVAIASSKQRSPLPRDTELRIAGFAELVAAALSTTDARSELSRLAAEQAALRRLATLVAEGKEPEAIFSAVSAEVAQILNSDYAVVGWFDGDHLVVAGSSKETPGVAVGARFPLDPSMASTTVRRTRRSARIDPDWSTTSAPTAAIGRRLGSVSVVSSPIFVEGGLWGTITVSAATRLPADTELRLQQFTEIVATAIADAQSRTTLRRLADEQAALRRVATLVAEGTAPADLFATVTQEVARLFVATEPTINPTIIRFDPGPEFTLVGASEPMIDLPIGSRWGPKDLYVSTRIRRSGRSARVDGSEVVARPGSDAELLRRQGILYQVGSPIVVDGRAWGALTMNSSNALPADTGARLESFTELVGTAIANAGSREGQRQLAAELTASRTRLVTAADEARRRVVRDLHDGAQQRLVHTMVTLKLARQALDADDEAAALVDEGLQQAEQANAELRELAHGLLPPVLTKGGLRAGVRAVVERVDLPIEADVPDRRFAPAIEATAYFIVAEALTNIVKHAEASWAAVGVAVEDGVLRVDVTDDGRGGADREGHGLLGIGDRAAALGGRLEVDSPRDRGTRVSAVLPLTPG